MSLFGRLDARQQVPAGYQITRFNYTRQGSDVENLVLTINDEFTFNAKISEETASRLTDWMRSTWDPEYAEYLRLKRKYEPSEDMSS